jgi:small basic protein
MLMFRFSHMFNCFKMSFKGNEALANNEVVLTIITNVQSVLPWVRHKYLNSVFGKIREYISKIFNASLYLVLSFSIFLSFSVLKLTLRKKN